MEENYISPILYNIFSHLNPAPCTSKGDNSRYRNLSSLFDRKKEESYFYILDKLIVNFGLTWIFQNGNIKEQYKVTPSLGIRFNIFQLRKKTRHERPCSNKQFNCFVVDLKSCNGMPISEKSDSLFRINFPIEDSPDVTILSFINQRVASKYSSNVIYFDEEDLNQASHFLAQLLNFVTQESFLSRIVIIFCRETCYKKFLRLTSIISFWFRFFRMTIWFAVVDEITICRYNFNNHYCKIDTEFLFMFINNPSYKAYIKYLHWHCDTPDKIRTQLKQFRQEIVLFEDSTAFMHVSNLRMKEFYFLDTNLFREVFPEVRLLPLLGETSHDGNTFFQIHNSSLYPNTEIIFKHTTILLISRQ